MATGNESIHASPSWFVAPGDSDFLAWFTLLLVCLAIYGIFVLYAFFDKWAEHRATGTPLAKTIPTMLTIALLYEVFPLGHFNILLPISAILIALMADWAHVGFDEISTTVFPSDEEENKQEDETPRDVDETLEVLEVTEPKNA